MSVFSISAPDPLMREVDELAERDGYDGRSALVRAALRSFLQEVEREREVEGERSATITVAYEEDQQGTLADVKHAFSHITTSMIHSHTSDRCLEVLMVEGDADEVRRLAHRLRGLTGVDRMNLFFVG